MSNLNEILADIKHEDDLDPFAALDTETNTPSESLPEKEPEAEEPVAGVPNTQPDEESDENSPFHKRWKQREEKLKADMEADFQSRFEELQQSLAKPASDSPEDVPDSFKRLYGDDPVAYSAWKEEQTRLKEETVRETIAEIQRSQQAEVQEAQYWNEWVDTEIARLTEQGEQFDRNGLIKVLLDYRPTTPDNNFDFDAGLRIYKALSTTAPQVDPAKSQARKQIADAATKATNSEPKKKDYLTPSDLRNKSWGSL